MIKADQIAIGDLLIRSRGIFSEHLGLCVGFQQGKPVIAENQPQAGVQKVTLETFLQDQEIRAIQRFDGLESDRKKVESQVNTLIGKDYDLVRFHCDFVQDVAPLEAEEAAIIRHLNDGVKNALRELNKAASMFLG